MYPALFRFTFLQMVIFSQHTTNSVKKLGAGTSAVGFGVALSSSWLKLRWHLCFSCYTHCTECKCLLGQERETTLLRQLQEVMSSTVCTEDRTLVPKYYQRDRGAIVASGDREGRRRHLLECFNQQTFGSGAVVVPGIWCKTTISCQENRPTR